MSVEALNAPQPDATGTGSAAITENTETTISDDDALGAAFDRVSRDNGAARDNGRFASPNGDAGDGAGNQEPLEGGGGEDTTAADTSTPAAGVPLPSNWQGLEEVWSRIPDELRDTIRAHEEKLHQTLSQQGRVLSSFKPIGDVISDYAEYFNGERASYKPHEAIQFLFGLQRGMDEKPLETLLSIADTFELRPQLAEMFGSGGEGQGQGQSEAVLLARIDQLENHIRGLADPRAIDQRITAKLTEDRELSTVADVVSRIEKEMPLLSEVAPQEMVFFIQKARTRIGETAAAEAVYKLAGEMAINADPDLRARAAAVKTAAAGDPDRVAAAKRANATNLRSQPSGRTRELTQEEELGAVYDKLRG